MKALIHVGCLIPVVGQAINDGAICVDGHSIKDVGSFKKLKSKYPRYRLIKKNKLIAAPGLINAHCHLELTSLKNKIFWRGSFVDWVKQIIVCKSRWQKKNFITSIEKGVNQLIKSGCTTVVDHSTQGYSWSVMNRLGMRGVSLFEMIMFDSQHIRVLKNEVLKFLKKDNDLVRKGVAVHSPYSVHPQLIRFASKLKQKKQKIVSAHVSELKEEIDFLKNKRNNPLKRLLVERNMWPDDWRAPNCSPVTYFHNLGIKKYLSVHNNFTQKKDEPIHHKDKNTVIYCPNSHIYFNHSKWPMRRYHRAKLNIALGTDSLASNTHLDLCREMKSVREQYPFLSDLEILKMTTINAARALGWQKEIGSLQKGKRADISFFKGPQEPEQAIKSIVSGQSTVKAVLCHGKWV